MESDAPPETILETMKPIAKLSARESLPILMAQSLPGIKLQHLENIPQELPHRSNATYFQIDHHSKQWEPVVKGNNMTLYWDMAPEDLKAELMIVRRN